MSKLSEFLYKRQYKNYFWLEEEYAFYRKYKKLIPSYPCFAAYKPSKIKKPFDVIRANIVLRGLLNKKIIEDEIKKRKLLLKIRAVSIESILEGVKEKANELPAFIDKDGNKILIPFFKPHLNEIYLNRIDNLLRYPYLKLRKYYADICVDPFDSYGPELYNSIFCKMIKIDQKGDVSAYYDYNSETLFFIDEQGRLENAFSLFDKYIASVDRSNITSRVKPVVQAYFNSDREGIIRALIDNKLISSTAIQEFVDNEDKMKYDDPK